MGCDHSTTGESGDPRKITPHSGGSSSGCLGTRGGQCTFVGAAGRCTERGCLEFHHVVSFATGGPPTVENIVLRCRHHNQYEATQEFPLFVRELVAGYVLEATHRVDTPLVRAESRMLHTCVT